MIQNDIQRKKKTTAEIQYERLTMVQSQNTHNDPQNPTEIASNQKLTRSK